MIFLNDSFQALFALAVLGIVAVALFAYPYSEPISPIIPPGNEFKEIPRFESYAALKAAFDESGGRGYGIWETIGGIAPAVATGASKDGAESGEAAQDYSTTNVQVQGVDEADIVKTDGKYIYNFSGNKLIITDAYPVEASGILSKTELKDIMPLEMFVSGNKLLLFGNEYENYSGEGVSGSGIAREMCYGCYWGSSNVIARLYNIADRSNPVLEKEFSFEGSYLTSRLIGEKAYFVINSWPSYRECDESKEDCIIPLMKEDGVEKKIAEPTEIGYLLPMPAESFVTIASMDLENAEMQKETIAGSAESVFASQGNIYLAATAWLQAETATAEGTVVKQIEEIILPSTEKTVINKFGLDNGKIGFVGQGQVPGHILNQFSMDEFEGNFRIATSIGWNGSNSLFVLDGEMKTIGMLEDLAPGESIYSARFIGKKAYLVTFKKVDPLFVIDLSEPTAPKVLGKLKIPGYSDYLHPIDETHIIGIGKETIESAYGDFAWYQGMKLAIFDVSDVANPIEMHKIIIGDRGTDSYALHDHKAFLFDKEKELLVLPITLAEIPAEQKKPLEQGQAWPEYGEYTFQGAFVFKVNLTDGFVERGRITHVSAEDELKRGYYFDDEYSVKRALFIDNVLYTLSNNLMKANALDTLQELKEFSFK